MSFLLDTNICSAFLKGDQRVFNRFIQHSGGLSVSAIVLGELYSWVFRARTNTRHRAGLEDLLSSVEVIPLDWAIARRFGEIRAALLDQGRPTPEMDLLIAATALSRDLTLVTHNLQDFAHISSLRLEDWLAA